MKKKYYNDLINRFNDKYLQFGKDRQRLNQWHKNEWWPQKRRKTKIRTKDKIISRRLYVREMVQQIKKKSRCINCGFEDYRALTFHHRNPGEKTFNIAEANKFCDELIMLQIGKCDVLCQNCHNALHYKQHLQKFNSKLLTLPKLTGISGSRKYGRTVKQQRKLNKQRIFIKSKQFIIDTKKNASCCKCGKTGEEYLCFHHRNTDQKVDDVSAIANKKSSVRLVKQQIAKCDIMCHNCHTIHHYNDIKTQTGFPNT